MMRVLITYLIGSLCLLDASAFTFQQRQSSIISTRSSTSLFSSAPTSGETEAERLLRKARELRAAAEQAELQVHGDLLQKKAEKDAQIDRVIDQLFGASSLVDKLREKRLAVSTLESIVDRLDKREVIALGGDNVELKKAEVGYQAERKATKNEEELAKLDGLIDRLIEAVGVLDAEFRAEHADGKIGHAEQQHWGGGKCAEVLSDRISQMRRERSDQFQKRMKDFQEAQRLKDDPDHQFKGYDDMGNLGG